MIWTENNAVRVYVVCTEYSVEIVYRTLKTIYSVRGDPIQYTVHCVPDTVQCTLPHS